ncbi:MAG: hypothetical protein P4L50_15460 [Anaerolineaceae bacterium]|nr:hypothetical protein [Anaerolineaceae bacterium]
MNPDPITRYLQRLPTLITFFFSIMLVNVFTKLSVLFNWSTGPTFDFRILGHDLVAVSFLTTLFYVVSVWLAYCLLIERFPYSLDYTVFFFDVVRFSVLFAIFNFAFLAGIPPYYWYYIAALGVYHLIMTIWHSNRLRFIQSEERMERKADIRGHLFRMSTYFVLAILYYFLVALPWHVSPSWGLQAVFVIVTSVLVVVFNVRRLGEVQIKALQAQEAAKSQQAATTQEPKKAAEPAR